jgi:hypothetical protein
LKTTEKTERKMSSFLLSPSLVERVKIRAIRERIRPNRLVEQLLTEAMSRRPELADEARAN